MDVKTARFVEQAKMTHGADRYDWSKFVYKGAQTPSTIICHLHGPFQKSPNHHIQRQQGCPKCSRSAMATRSTLMLDEGAPHYNTRVSGRLTE